MLKDIKQIAQVPPIQQIGTDGRVFSTQLEYYLIRRKDRRLIPYKLREKHIIGQTGAYTTYLITKVLYDMIIAEGGGKEPLALPEKAKIKL